MLGLVVFRPFALKQSIQLPSKSPSFFRQRIGAFAKRRRLAMGRQHFLEKRQAISDGWLAVAWSLRFGVAAIGHWGAGLHKKVESRFFVQAPSQVLWCCITAAPKPTRR
jgi:hypothetical protein